MWILYIVISSQSLNLDGRRGTTDDVATVPLHPSLSSAALRESPNSIPVHSLMLSSDLFFLFLSFLLLSMSPAELSSPCQRTLRCGHTISFSASSPWLRHHHALQLHSGFCCDPPRSSDGLCRKRYEVSYSISSQGLDPSLDFCCQGPALTGIRNVDKMGVRISLTLAASEMFLSLHMIFSLERAAVVSMSPAELSSPCQRTLRCGHTICFSASSPWLRHHHALQLQSGFCCDPPRSSDGLCRKCYEVSYIISSQGLDPSLDFCYQGPALTGIRNVDKMGVRISLTLAVSEMFLSLHMIFSLERTAVVSAILERILGFDPSSEMIAPRYLPRSTSKFPTTSSL